MEEKVQLCRNNLTFINTVPGLFVHCTFFTSEFGIHSTPIINYYLYNDITCTFRNNLKSSTAPPIKKSPEGGTIYKNSVFDLLAVV